MTWVEVESEQLLEPPLVVKDIKGARPTVSNTDLEKNAQWTAEFGSEGA